MAKTTVLMMIDGFGPEYAAACPMPNLQGLAARGSMIEGRGMMPSVTNVNNVSIVTATYPEVHGITSNYWYDRRAGAEVYMESGEYIMAETIFQAAQKQGARSLLVTAKDKLRRLLGDGTTLSFSSEQAPDWVVELAGEPPPIYSLEVNGWVIEAANRILERESYDLVYLATTDYAMHSYAPEAPESSRHLGLIDGAIGRLTDILPDMTLLLTADHGMSAKSRMIDLRAELAAHGIEAQPVPVIKDMYTVHHSNLGGCIYVYLDDRHRETAVEALEAVDGVDRALTREMAAAEFHLMPERAGDLMVLGAPDVVFGDPPGSDHAPVPPLPRLPPRRPGAHHSLGRRPGRVPIQGKQGLGPVRLRASPGQRSRTGPGRTGLIVMATENDMERPVRVKAPATTANMGPGFDCLGMALDLWNTLEARPGPPTADGEPLVRVLGEGAGELSQDDTNLAYRAMAFLFHEAGRDMPPVRLVCRNEIPLARGLGSSAAAIAGGLVAANAMCSRMFGPNELLEMAATIEGHPDNVTAALLGGLQLVVADGQELYTAPITLPPELHAVLFIPERRIATADARAALPETVPLGDAVRNVGRAALLVAAMTTNHPEYLSLATEDRLHQPYRQKLFPAMKLLFQAARDAGALGAFLSGSGSTVLALTRGREMTVAYEMAEAARQAGVEGRLKVVQPSAIGAHAIDSAPAPQPGGNRPLG